MSINKSSLVVVALFALMLSCHGRRSEPEDILRALSEDVDLQVKINTNQCNPSKTCNVCKGCCHEYIPNGKPCDNCVSNTCPPTPLEKKNQCNPSQTCNVCKECCHEYIPLGKYCDSCVSSNCPPKQNQCNPSKTCNVCKECCHEYIPVGTPCDKCVQASCGHQSPTPPPSPSPTPPPPPVLTPAAIPHDTLPNIGKLLRGYDILKGNPLPTDNAPVDPGYRSPIFKASYLSRQRTADQRFSTPDGTFVDKCTACSLSFSTTQIQGASSYQQALETKVSAEGSGWGAKFSASSDYKRVAKGSSSADMVYTQSTAQCCVYQAGLNMYQKPELSENFIAGIKDLPAEYNSDAYLQFIQVFGTHYVEKVAMGSLYGIERSFTRTAYQKMRSHGLDIKAAASFSAFGASVGGGVDNNSTKGSMASALNAVSNSRTYTMGSKPQKDQLKWAQQCVENPAPFQVVLKTIDGVLGDHANSQVKANLRKALSSYCEYLEVRGETSSCDVPAADQPLPLEGRPTVAPSFQTAPPASRHSHSPHSHRPHYHKAPCGLFSFVTRVDCSE